MIKALYCNTCGSNENFEMVKRLKIWDANKGEWIKDDEDEHECVICMECGSTNIDEYEAAEEGEYIDFEKEEK